MPHNAQAKALRSAGAAVPSGKPPARSSPSPLPADGRARAVVDHVTPAVDNGRFAVKRVVGEELEVTAHAFTDGHDQIRVVLVCSAEGEPAAQEIDMQPRGNDVWTASFVPEAMGRYRYTVAAWVDPFASWRADFPRRVGAADILLAVQGGARLAEAAAQRADAEDREVLARWAQALRKRAMALGATRLDQAEGIQAEVNALAVMAQDSAIADLIGRYPDRSLEVRYSTGRVDTSGGELPLVVDRERAGFSAWYEMFPRSAALEEGRHGTLRDVQARLPYVAELGFQVLYLPPIHPIGRSHRKGRNNRLSAEPEDTGSPWAIGAEEGGHKSVLPALGTLEDFRALVEAARGLDIEVALDIAFQCAPDHPYVRQHPTWFKRRADGSVQYAENPPKKYQDIYPFDFETKDWEGLWLELKSIFDHWIAFGVKIFRVDNPHTKAFAFWEWVIAAIKRDHPDVLFLSEAFTRPKVMHRLAKIGYSQSYTYFTWRSSREELTDYFTELAHGPGADYFRPNAWPNTPDILPEHLHHAPRAAFQSRLVLAATLCANYGIYGPAYELMESAPRSAGSEEYLDSEKYQVRHWDLDRADSLRDFIAQVNRIRRDNPALHGNRELRFFPTDNPRLIAYAKRLSGGEAAVLTVVNLDATFRQSGWVDVDASWLGMDGQEYFLACDQLGGGIFRWQTGTNFVALDPAQMPAHVMRIERSQR